MPATRSKPSAEEVAVETTEEVKAVVEDSPSKKTRSKRNSSTTEEVAKTEEVVEETKTEEKTEEVEKKEENGTENGKTEDNGTTEEKVDAAPVVTETKETENKENETTTVVVDAPTAVIAEDKKVEVEEKTESPKKRLLEAGDAADGNTEKKLKADETVETPAAEQATEA